MYVTVKGARGGHEIRDKPLRKFRGEGVVRTYPLRKGKIQL